MYTGTATYRYSNHEWRVVAAFPQVMGGELGDGPKSYTYHYLALAKLDSGSDVSAVKWDRIILDTDRGLSWPVKVDDDEEHVLAGVFHAGLLHGKDSIVAKLQAKNQDLLDELRMTDERDDL